ncbi:kinesin-like protein KIN-10C isoform X2 [Vicia villosa]|uniref:kinesin-like protein KIN-10C isoform X2 n=1 Tax=Vicia villosa TaxID=3911 RepID=UPI00273B9627|nr:kinesin-like protein KIN-10C isoform X2 [Vicia villosa]
MAEIIQGPKVRVVAKIRGFSDPDINFETSRTVEWVSVNTESSGEVTISFKEQSSSRYAVDYCYNEHEDNEVIYSKEVKPLVSAAFEGINSTVIAHGARGSGKTQLIQGSLEKSGLAMLAISEFLSVAEKNEKSIAVSFYDVDHQDHAADLLNPEQSPILVLEDHGRIQFKGLTQTPVKSIAEFQNLYITACSAHTAAPKKGFEAAPKKGLEPARRSHLGLIVHVFEHNESANGLVSKMNFVDMAGYEDPRRKSGDASGVAENNKINKSIYALLNVCHALSANESRVPFRESKLTRMLQDSLRGTSKVLLVSCLNPSFCQDTVYMLSLASRSCQRSHRTPFGSTMKTASSTRQTVNLESTKKIASSARQTVTLDSSKKIASSARQTATLDSSKKIASSARQTVTLDSSKKIASSARQTITLDSSKKSVSSVRQPVTLDSTKKSASSVRQTVTLDSTRKSASSVRQSKTLDSTRKSENSVRQSKTLDSTRKSENSVRQTKTLDSTRRSENSETKTLDSTKKSASSARQTVASVSAKKSTGSAMQFVTVRKNKIPKSVSASTKELPGSISHTYDEETCVIAMKSEIQGRKLFDEVSHSAAKAEKVDSSLNASSKVELDPKVEKGTSFEDKEETNYIINYSKDLSMANEGHNMNKENNNLMENEDCSPPISSQLRELQSLVSSTPLCMQLPEEKLISLDDNQISTKTAEPRTSDTEHLDVMNNKSFWETFNMHGYEMKNSTEVSEPRTLDIEIRDGMNAKSPWETFNMHGSGMKNSTEVTEEPRTPDIDIRDVMNTKSHWETFNLHGSGFKNSTEVTEPRTPDIDIRDAMNTKSPWETFMLHGSGRKNSTKVAEPRTPDVDIRDVMNTKSPWETFNLHGSGMKNSLVKDYLRILNTAEKDELKKLKGIGEKRANYILELREESPEPFKSLDDLKDIGLSEKQIKGMMKKEVGELFN